MSLAELRPSEAVFVDANIFIYHFGGRSSECKDFLERCARGDVTGYTATPVLAEVLHRLMVAEAIQEGLVPSRTAVRRLKERPDLVMRLSRYNEDVARIEQMNLTILSLTPEVVAESAAIRRDHGWLTNDSLVVALMRAHQLVRLATTDGDFKRVLGIETYRPVDLT